MRRTRVPVGWSMTLSFVTSGEPCVRVCLWRCLGWRQLCHASAPERTFERGAGEGRVWAVAHLACGPSELLYSGTETARGCDVGQGVKLRASIEQIAL